ncbi:MAG: hypothetical protein NZM94_11455 [Roseiflexus sp.]|nr:hypothetical protein [Roseiflexus sp.]
MTYDYTPTIRARAQPVVANRLHAELVAFPRPYQGPPVLVPGLHGWEWRLWACGARRPWPIWHSGRRAGRTPPPSARSSRRCWRARRRPGAAGVAHREPRRRRERRVQAALAASVRFAVRFVMRWKQQNHLQRPGDRATRARDRAQRARGRLLLPAQPAHHSSPQGWGGGDARDAVRPRPWPLWLVIARLGADAPRGIC